MAFINLLDIVYPIGSVYISYENISPANIFGGKWVAITGRFPYFNAGVEVGGSNNAIIVEHSHTGSTNTAGEHTHAINLDYGRDWIGDGWNYSASSSASFSASKVSTNAGAHSHAINIDSTGSSGLNANMPAYQTLYAWRRTE